MPGERAESKLSQSFRRIVDHMQTDGEKRYVWGCELRAGAPVTWDHTEEDDDEDFVVHTLHLKHVTLGAGAADGERHVVEMETKTFDGQTLALPLASLTRGGQENFSLDVELTNEIPATFRLVEGSGPVHITAQHTVEFPSESDDEDEALTEVDTCDEEDDVLEAKALKRKHAVAKRRVKAKKAKLGSATDQTEEDSDDEEEEDGGEDEVDDEEEVEGEESAGGEQDEEDEDEEDGEDGEEEEDAEDEEEMEEDSLDEEEAVPEPPKKEKKKVKNGNAKKAVADIDIKAAKLAAKKQMLKAKKKAAKA